MNVILAAATQPSHASWIATTGWWSLDLLIIVAMTSLLALRDLEAISRRFDWRGVVTTAPFVTLVAIQSVIVLVAFIALVSSGRGSYRYGIDAFWISVAGVSLLKAIPVAKDRDTQKLWGLAEWLFGKFYREMQLGIVARSDIFKAYLRARFTQDPDRFLDKTRSLVSSIERPENAEAVSAQVQERFEQLKSPEERVMYLANWVAPRCTRREWDQLDP